MVFSMDLCYFVNLMPERGMPPPPPSLAAFKTAACFSPAFAPRDIIPTESSPCPLEEVANLIGQIQPHPGGTLRSGEA